MLEAARKLLAKVEDRIAALDDVDERTDKQDTQYDACTELQSALEEFIDAYEAA